MNQQPHAHELLEGILSNTRLPAATATMGSTCHPMQALHCGKMGSGDTSLSGFVVELI